MMIHAFRAAVEEFVDVDVDMLGDAEIRETYLSARREIDRQEALAATLLDALDRRGIARSDGAASVPAWVEWQTGQRRGAAAASLQAGRICTTLPLTAKAWAQGEIATSAAFTISRGQKAGHEDVYRAMEADLVDQAARHNYRGLDARIAHYRTRADALDGTDPSERNGLRHSPVGDRWKTNGNYHGLAGAIINTAILAAMDKPGADDTRSIAKRRADASVRIHQFFLDHETLPVEDGERPHLTLLITQDPRTGHLASTDGTIAHNDIEQLLCNARMSCIVMGADRIPLEAGQITYRPTPRLRRAVIARDRGCRFPGCHRPARWSEVHHVNRWPTGPTKRDNLVCVCDYHHHLLHKPGWHASFDGTDFTVTNPDGHIIGTTRAGPDG